MQITCNGVVPEKELTIWYCKADKEAKLKYNHYSEGYDSSVKVPVGVTPDQVKSWTNSIWFPRKGYLVNGSVVEADPNVEMWHSPVL